jgi:SAM-dependent methyltransferase
MAIPAIHERVLEIVSVIVPPIAEMKVLDLGAGEGALSWRLNAAGYYVEACDLLPELFRCPGVRCQRVDLHQKTPYADTQFDLVAAVEVVEHLESQLPLFNEVNRILRPGGIFIFTTPNIASLKSRMSFLLTGFFYSHGPLDVSQHDPISQHLAAFTPNRYRFMLARAGLELIEFATDKFQRSSRLLGWLSPLVRLLARRQYGNGPGVAMANDRVTLYGRTLIGVARKVNASNTQLARQGAKRPHADCLKSRLYNR